MDPPPIDAAPESPPPKSERSAFAILASCFGLGYSPIMPGTCGALLGPLIYVPLALFVVPGEPYQSLAIALALGIWIWITIALGNWSEKYYGVKDSQIFVTDEVVGFLFTVLLFHIPSHPLLTAAWAFPVTRVIDILKIPPARRLERLPAGWGVVADDLLGSVYAAALLHVVCLLAPGWFGIRG
jgi:phosphatidylglycerophosphatase A